MTRRQKKVKRGLKPMPAKRQNESFTKVAEDLELLCIKEDYQHGEGKGTARKESRYVEGIKRNFGEGKLLLINRGQAHIPYKNGRHAKL